MANCNRGTSRTALAERVRRAGFALAVGTLAALPAIGAAAPLSAGAGYDYYQGPGGQITRGPLGVVGVGLGSVLSASLSGMRYDDNLVGNGTSVTGGLGFGMIPATQLRVWGSRYVGDESYRAWRLKTGPQVSLPTGQQIGLYYSRYSDQTDATSDGVVGELTTPLIARWSGRASAAYATTGDGLKSTQGSVGLSFSPIHALELSGEVGLARNGAAATQPFPSGHGLHLPLIGGNPSPGASQNQPDQLDTTVLMGIRLWFP